MAKDQNVLQNETAAMQTIATAFEKLPKESQQRIVTWLLSYVGVAIKPASDLPNTQASIPAQSNVIGPAYQKTEDAKEFFHSKNPKNNYQKLAVLGYYLEFLKGRDEFNSQDLRIAWKQTREALPSAQVFSTCLNNTISTYNYFVSGQKKGWYRIGIKGQKLVETLPDQPKSSIKK